MSYKGKQSTCIAVKQLRDAYERKFMGRGGCLVRLANFAEPELTDVTRHH